MKKMFVLFFLIAIMSIGLMAQDKVTVQVNSTSANLWYFHSPNKGLNFYFMETWPTGTLLTKFGPPTIVIGKTITMSIAAGPDINVKAKTAKDIYKSFTIDVVPAIFAGKFSAVLVNEAGIDKNGKGIFFLRHSIGYGQIGLMYSACGQFGKKAYFFRIGPTIRFGKLQLWFAKDTLNKDWLVEASFSFKI